MPDRPGGFRQGVRVEGAGRRSTARANAAKWRGQFGGFACPKNCAVSLSEGGLDRRSKGVLVTLPLVAK